MLSLSLPRRPRARSGKAGGCRGAKQNWVTGASFTLRGHSWDLPTVRFSSFRHIPWLFPKFSSTGLSSSCVCNPPTRKRILFPPFFRLRKYANWIQPQDWISFPVIYLFFLSCCAQITENRSPRNFDMFLIMIYDWNQTTRYRSWWIFSGDIECIISPSIL